MVRVHIGTIFTKENGRQLDGHYLDDNLKANFDNYIIRAVKNKHDAVTLYSGMEGSGKSTIAMTLAYYCDPTFNVKRVVFSTNDLIDAIDNAKRGQAIVFDEAVIGMSSGDSSTQLQKTLIKKFVTIRKKGLYILIVIPSIFMLKKYFAIFRTRLCIHTYCPDGIARGYFKFFSYKRKRLLYIRGIKEMDMGAQKPDFNGRFTDTSGFYFDMDEYEARKDEAIRKLTSDDDSPTKKIRNDMNAKMIELKEKYKESIGTYRSQIKVMKSQLSEYSRELKKENTKDKNAIKLKIRDEYKDKVIKAEGKYHKTLITLFNQIKEQRASLQNEDFSIKLFSTFLRHNKIDSITSPTLKKMMEDGKFQKEFWVDN